MRILTEYRQIDTAKWDDLLQKSPFSSWFQSKDAYLFYQSIPNCLTPFVFAVENGENCIKGILLGYITKDTNPLKQLFTKRAIIYSGPLLAEDILEAELSELLKTAIDSLRHQAIYIETRNFHDYSRFRYVFEQAKFLYQPHYDIHINCSHKELMIKNINESRKRQIRHLLDEYYTYTTTKNPDEIGEFYTLLSKLYAEKIHLPLFPQSFFQNFIQKDFGKLLIVKQDGQIKGGMLCPILNGKILYEWYVVGPQIVTYFAMDYANLNNIPVFDLMGAGEPQKPYGVRDFKLTFGGELKEYGRYLHINNHLRYNLGKLAVKILQNK